MPFPGPSARDKCPRSKDKSSSLGRHSQFLFDHPQMSDVGIQAVKTTHTYSVQFCADPNKTPPVPGSCVALNLNQLIYLLGSLDFIYLWAAAECRALGLTFRQVILNPTLNGKWYLVRIVHTREDTGRDLHTQRPSKGTDYDLVRGMPQRRGKGSKRYETPRDKCLLLFHYCKGPRQQIKYPRETSFYIYGYFAWILFGGWGHLII